MLSNYSKSACLELKFEEEKLVASRSSLHKKEKTDAATFFVIGYKNGYFE